MTAPAPRPKAGRSRSAQGLRVLTGRRQRRQPLGPWVIFSAVAVVAFLGMVLTRTSLDRIAIELTVAESQLAEAKSLNQRLRLEIARLESPARIAPAAQALGMVYPQSSNRLVVEGVIGDTVADPRWAEINRFAAQALSSASDQTAGTGQP